MKFKYIGVLYLIVAFTLGYTLSVSAQELREKPKVLAQPAQQAPVGQTTTYSVAPNLAGTQTASRYTLGANDVIAIEILRHPEVSGEFMINQEGYIQYEFVGDLKVAGLTKRQLADQLKEQLSEYIIAPDITVKIIGYNSKVVYVIGEVGRPGKIFMRGDEITIREALIQAGLPLLTAKNSKSMLITPAENGKAETRNVNVKKLLFEGDLRENFVMKPGDTLYIPPTAMAKAMRVIQPIAAPITTAAGAGRSIYTGGF